MKQFRFLLIAVVIVALAAWFTQQRQAQRFAAGDQTLLLPQLAAQLDAAHRVRIVAAGADTVTLEHAEQGWQLLERRYPADASALRRALRALAEAHKLEPKTALAANYPRLGVEDVDLASDTTIQLTVVDAQDRELLNLIIGKAGPGGSYVRLADEAQSWLISQTISLPGRIPDWLDRSLVSLPRGELSRIEVQPLDGPGYALIRPDNDAEDHATTGLRLEPPPPEGREANAANINRLSAALAGLRIEDVLDEAPADLSWASLRFVSQDELALQVSVARQDGDRYLKLLAEGDDERATRLNARADGRVFRAPQFAIDAMLMRYDMLLRPKEDS